MRSHGLKIVILLGLAGAFPALGQTCYEAYENGFRNSLGQNNPKQVIDEYHECLRLEQDRRQRDIASQQFRAQSGHGGNRAQVDAEGVATERAVAARPIPPALRPYEPIALSHPERPSAVPQMPDECVGSRYTYVAQDGSTTCPAAAANARVAVNQFRQERDSQILALSNELRR